MYYFEVNNVVNCLQNRLLFVGFWRVKPTKTAAKIVLSRE